MTSQVIGISLIKNEDIFINQAIKNIVEFCDKVIILNNLSTDNTWREIEKLQSKFSNIEAHQLMDYRLSHNYIAGYAGTKTWVFGLDGDEIYDPARLKIFRNQILAGEFDNYWAIFGNVVNCTNIDWKNNKAEGYPSPPSRSMTKLYNFSALEMWESNCQRLHGGNKIFRQDYNEILRYSLNSEISWKKSPFRCLHLCFVQRSSIEKNSNYNRLNINERPRWLIQLDKMGFGWFIDAVIQYFPSQWKNNKYRSGDIVKVDISPFFTKN